MTTLTAAQQTALTNAFASAKAGLSIKLQSSDYPKPKVTQADGDVLDPWVAEPLGVQVEVAYDSMSTSDIIGLSFNGDDSFTPVNGSFFKKVTFTAPATDVAAAVGKTVPVIYAVVRPDGVILSDYLNLEVKPIEPTRLPTPTITQASGSVLDLNTFEGPAQLVIGKWPLSLTGQRVWLTVSGPGGVPTYKVLEGYPITAQEASNGIARDIPRVELEKFVDGSQLTVKCRVGFGGSASEAGAVEFPNLQLTIKTKPITVIENFDSLPLQIITSSGEINTPTMSITFTGGGSLAVAPVINAGLEFPGSMDGMALHISYGSEYPPLPPPFQNVKFKFKELYSHVSFYLYANSTTPPIRAFDINDNILSQQYPPIKNTEPAMLTFYHEQIAGIIIESTKTDWILIDWFRLSK